MFICKVTCLGSGEPLHMAHCRGSHAGTPSHREAGLRIALLEVYIEVEIPPLGMRMCSMLLRGDGPPMKDQTPHKVLSHIRDAAFRRDHQGDPG